MKKVEMPKVNFIRHLLVVSDKFIADDRLSASHISLYYALFHNWNLSKFHNPISICREEIMRASKIGSANTYTKCLKELDSWQYLKYVPSFNSHKGSKIYLYIFNKPTDNGTDISNDKATDKGSDKTTDKGTNKATVKAVIPSINSINNINIINNRKREKIISNKKLSLKKINVDEKSEKKSKNSEVSKVEKSAREKKVEGLPEIPSCHPELVEVAASGKKEKSSGQKEKIDHPVPERSRRADARFQRPLLLEVQTYFKQKAWPSIEADKYFNHYQSNGWLVAGKTPMADWQASAEKWMLNFEMFTHKTQTIGPRSLSVVEGKNYNEPL
jgi:hypothetical protein